MTSAHSLLLALVPLGGGFDQRIRADGTTAWTWPPGPQFDEGATAHLAATDTLVASITATADPDHVTIRRVDASGLGTVVSTLPASANPLLLIATPGDASPPGFAVITLVPSMMHLDVFDASGAPAWSGDLLDTGPLPLMLTRDAIAGFLPTATDPELVILGPTGPIAHLGDNPATLPAPNGDLILSQAVAGGSIAVTRVRPDGSTAWQTQVSPSLDGLFPDAATTAVVTGTTVRIFDAAGAATTWAPPGDPTLVVRVGGVRVSPSGAFRVIAQPSASTRRVLRVAADGTLLWHETFSGDGATILPLQDPSEERLLVAFDNFDKTPPRLHVFEP